MGEGKQNFSLTRDFGVLQINSGLLDKDVFNKIKLPSNLLPSKLLCVNSRGANKGRGERKVKDANFAAYWKKLKTLLKSGCSCQIIDCCVDALFFKLI